MRVDPHGEAVVGLPELVGDGARGFSGSDEHQGIEVAQRLVQLPRLGSTDGRLRAGLDRQHGASGRGRPLRYTMRRAKTRDT